MFTFHVGRSLSRVALAAGASIAISMAGFLAPIANATTTFVTYYVGTATDDAGSVSKVACTSSSNTTCSLRDAITTANADGNGFSDTISFAGAHAPTTVTVSNTYGPLVVSDSGILIISGAGANKTTVSGGGVVRVMTTSAPSLTISNLTIANGHELVGDAGGIYNNGSGNLTLHGVNFTGNRAGPTTSSNDSRGGAIYNTAALSITGGTFSNNSATGCGGAIYTSGSTLTIDQASLLNNSSECGGAIYISNGPTVTVTRSLLAGNYSRDYGDGGAIENHGVVTLTNDTLANNTSTEYGGGLANDGGSHATLTNDTIVGNSALEMGGGIYVNDADPLAIGNSILQGNTVYGGVANQCFGYGPVTSNGYNVIAHDSDPNCGFAGTGDKINTSAMVSPLASNGGPTATMSLKSSSPAVLIVPQNLCPQLDQRGITRPSRCDAGAYELLPTSSSVSCAALSGTFATSITFAKCTPTSATNKTVTIGGTLLATGGKLTWHPSSKTTIVALAPASGGHNSCTGGQSEFDDTGVVTGGSSAYTHYFDKVSIKFCASMSSAKITLAPGSKVLL